jgi:hypothetical protein
MVRNPIVIFRCEVEYALGLTSGAISCRIKRGRLPPLDRRAYGSSGWLRSTLEPNHADILRLVDENRRVFNEGLSNGL